MVVTISLNSHMQVVYRPMDLSTIKRRVDNGEIRCTSEFQRDVMLMFTNAVMYNNAEHDVHKMALEMYEDVMSHIEVSCICVLLLCYVML